MDRSRGIYFVAIPEDDEEGFFASLFGGDENEEKQPAAESEAVEEKGLPEEHYQFHMIQESAGVLLIKVTNGTGQPLPEARAIQMLNRIKGYLS